MSVTVSKDFTAVGAGPHNLLKNEGSLEYTVSGTFVGTVILEKSRNGGLSWSQVGSAISGTSDLTLLVEDPASQNEWFRFRCTAYTSGTISTSLIATDPVTSGSGGGGGSTAFADLTGSATDNSSLSSALTAKLDTSAFTNAAVTGKVLTGYTSGAGTVAATDSILQAIQKLNGNATNIKTTADAALPTTSFTDAAVSGKVLTGYVSGAGTVAATDSILQAIQKLNGNAALLAPLASPIFTGIVKMPVGAGVGHYDSSGTLTSSAVSLTADVSGVLPRANGGTNSSTALNNNRVMVSSGGAIVEASAITAAKMLYSDANGIPASDTFGYDAINHILSVPVNSGSGNFIQLGTNAHNFVATEISDSTRQINMVPTSGRYHWYEQTLGVYMTSIPSSGYAQWGFGDGTHVYDLIKPPGKNTSQNAYAVWRLLSSVTSASNSSTTETDLIVFTVGAKSLGSTKDSLYWDFSGTFASNGNTKTVKVYFGSSTVLNLSGAYNGGNFYVSGHINRTGASTQVYASRWNSDNATLGNGASTGTLSITDTSNQSLKLTGQSGTQSSDVTGLTGNVETKPLAN